jgi:transcriptional regulator GlxA family with amidase domain
MTAPSGTKHISLVATPDIIPGTLAGLNDVFTCFGALGWFDPSLARHPPFTVEIVSPGHGPVTLASGMTLPHSRSVEEMDHTDLVIVPSVMVEDGEWGRGRYPRLVDWLGRTQEDGAELCSACSGTFLLAETGLLDGRRATMHWAYADIFRRNFPAVDLRVDQALITEGERNQLVMSGAASSWHDLALYLIARHLGAAAAQAVAKFFAFDFHRDGLAPYSVFSPRYEHGDAQIRRAQTWIEQHLGVASPVKEMMTVACLTERSFKRRFKQATGLTPIRYVQALRLDEAKRRLEQSREPIDEIAWTVGYEDPAFFRRLFKRQVGITPGAHRRKFRVPTGT